MNLGRTIQNLRHKKKIKQTELCQHCGISVSFLSQIENNKKEPSISTLKNISDFFNIPLPVLFFTSITSEDISSEKRNDYKIIEPFLQNFINMFVDDE
jgi:XRE family transcriptional regulator, regulator of sulfur utilization